MRVQQFSDNVPALESLKATDIYRLCWQVWQGVRPSARDERYLRREIARQGQGNGILFRGWLFDFSPLLNAQLGAQMDLFTNY